MFKQRKICLIYNYAQHYRSTIFQFIDKEFDCNFVFGDKYLDIKKMDYSLLEHEVTEVKNCNLFIGHYQRGVLKQLFKGFNTYILLGDIKCLSTWMFAIFAKFLPNKKVYFWSHGLLCDNKKLKTLIYKFFFLLPNGSFIYNNRSRELLIKNGIAPHKLFTIYNSLSYDSQLILRNGLKSSNIYQSHFKNNNKTLCFIGRLTKIKRLDLVIEAMYILKQKGEFYNLVLIGNGEIKSELQNLVSSRDLEEQIWFYGACYDEKANAELIYNADLCVSPGNIGLTAIHSLMFGCPALTNDDFNTQMPEYESIIDGKTGCFFIKGDSNDLAQKISSWFKCYSNLREEIRKNCYLEIDTKWNPHTQINILKKVLD